MDSKKLALLCRELADNKKADNIAILDLRKLPGVTDFMVICTGTSDPHLRAVQEEIADKLAVDHGLKPRAVDGTRNSGWIVLDYVDVLVHVMKGETRAHYDLEGLWNDAPRVRATKRKSATKRAKKPAVEASAPTEAADAT
ncbi:MAG: ribosome silencing factor [Verrucomicrobiales bacterium]|nr:ribosome silencing factor [Verrucomicrobiales bacterium]